MIGPDTLAQVKERTDIVGLIGESVRLIRRGRSLVGLCPFHKEKSPSFHVHPERGFFHCFGCGESGSAIDFAMKQNGLEFVEAVRFLAGRAGIVIEEVRGERTEARSERDELFSVMQLAASFYESALGYGEQARRHPLAHYAEAELGRRGMPPRPPVDSDWAKARAAFRIGYAPAGWSALRDFLKEQGVSPLVAERAGLIAPGKRGHYDRFRHRLMFAVADPMGRVVAFSGRALPPLTREEQERHQWTEPEGQAPAKYINSPESPIYRKGEQLFGLFAAKSAIRQRGHAILVEGNFDTVVLHASGFDHAVAPLGTAFTAEQAKLLKRFSPRVVISFDGDAAGMKAIRAARLPCREGGLEAQVASMPRGLDPDEFLRTKGKPAFEALLKSSVGLLEFLVQEALNGEAFEGASMNERVGRVKAVTELLSEETDPNVRMMAKRFADRLSAKLIVGNAPADDLVQLERLVQASLSGGAAPKTAPHVSPEDRQALAVVGTLLDFPNLLEDPEIAESFHLLSGQAALAVSAIRRHLTGRPESEIHVADFLATLPGTIQRFAARRLASPHFDDLSTAKAELVENLNKLRNITFTRQNVAARDVLEKARTLDDESLVILREAAERARRKRGLDD